MVGGSVSSAMTALLLPPCFRDTTHSYVGQSTDRPAYERNRNIRPSFLPSQPNPFVRQQSVLAACHLSTLMGELFSFRCRAIPTAKFGQRPPSIVDESARRAILLIVNLPHGGVFPFLMIEGLSQRWNFRHRAATH